MSYLVLARKWRPKKFDELAGQEHVVRALVNALNSGRVHHAFLFTGTRGVGKTTIARIFAKSLNCETGTGANPCGVCATCREIDEGRFVDLLEVDAASRTKVDDTRELLDNVQYAPARGRYKVYLIDEVHMLSTHSFNALLKTLEEPPPHVKFLLATTDPQKLPITVLSRCMQFNLKRLPQTLINKRMSEILQAENIAFEPDALRLIARAAEGSMRDALSLLDQAIAFGNGGLTASDTRSMLGTIDHRQVNAIAFALAQQQPRELLRLVAEMDEHAPDYRDVLAELAALLQRVALLQAVPDLDVDEGEDRDVLQQLAQAFSPEEVQLCYQIAITGRRDLDLAPEARGGFEMVLLRMVAFRNVSDAPSSSGAPSVTPRTAARPSSSFAQPASASSAIAVNVPAAARSSAASQADNDDNEWLSLVKRLDISGPTAQLAAHCTLQKREPGKLFLLLDADAEHLRRPALEEKLRTAVSAALNEEIKFEFVAADHDAALDTPARRQQMAAADKLASAAQAIYDDPTVRQMVDMFGATVKPDSIKPIN
ncbi:MAG TPA: DNA polymerase III subunit gamma/tau [Steroidobacteraceae bacterium]|nr:DNA polymerase III subunit gamma/tau [Steroidobacteraceae bacterium]